MAATTTSIPWCWRCLAQDRGQGAGHSSPSPRRRWPSPKRHGGDRLVRVRSLVFRRIDKSCHTDCTSVRPGMHNCHLLMLCRIVTPASVAVGRHICTHGELHPIPFTLHSRCDRGREGCRNLVSQFNYLPLLCPHHCFASAVACILDMCERAQCVQHVGAPHRNEAGKQD